MKRRKFWLVAIIAFATSVLVLWLRSRPPAKVVSIGTITLPKPIDQHWLSKQGKGEVLFLVTEDGKGWKVKIRDRKLICQSTQITNAIGVHYGLFDMDKDGYPELFKLKDDQAKGFGYSLWVFKQKENIKGRKVKQLPFPSWFPLSERSNWVLWARIPMPSGHAAYLILITEQKPKHPRKVVICDRAGSHGGLFFLLSPDGQRLIPFDSGIWQAQDYWLGVESVEDLDHDGIFEIVTFGRSHDRIAPGHIGIYKWDGQNYRLWWTSKPKGEYVIWAKLFDLRFRWRQ
ncbi:MAG: hypothetical protein NZ805_04630 [Armatimonadetes bacterium]|nr:hypothetical protein [Armatimonadota bacterium]MDW8027225.1 hypothetical protein [Armatimonadota bacterium]